MPTELSAAVERALEAAARCAVQANAERVRPEDMLRGLLQEEEGRAYLQLVGAGVEAALVRSVLAPVPANWPAAAPVREMELERGSLEVLVRARELARTHSADATVTGEFVVLALVEQDAALRARLEGIGLRIACLRDRVAPEHPPLLLEEPLEMAEGPELASLARLLDASANRAREALRVLEDYGRFVLDDAFLSGRLKDLRHALAQALGELPAHLLLSARDTLHDVGAALTTPTEHERASMADVLAANAKRLQEALRSLEEYGKVLSPTLGMAIERLRYQAYTLEPALSLGMAARSRLADAQLYVLVTAALCRTSLVGTVRNALEGGAQVIQLREKHDADRALLDKARDIRKLTRAARALFIVNDRPDIAVLAEADGVHLGQDDMAVRDARKLLGPGALIGVSTHNIEQTRRAILDGASYLGVGPTFPSRTKSFDAFAGLDFVRQAASETSLPAFALGGIALDNIDQVLAAGARRIAVAHAVVGAADVRSAAAALRAKMAGVR